MVFAFGSGSDRRLIATSAAFLGAAYLLPMTNSMFDMLGEFKQYVVWVLVPALVLVGFWLKDGEV